MPRYIQFPVETDPEALAQQAFDRLRVIFPSWVPNDGNLDTIMIETLARMSAVVRTLASMVPEAIFRFFGETLLDILPIDAAAASGNSTWSVRDNAGYTIPVGTQVGVRKTGDELIPFYVLNAVTIPPGQTATASGAVQLVAVEPGLSGSGLTGAAELIDPLDFVSAVSIVGTTTGGIDGESDADYIDRLTGQLTLMAPRPILPGNFALMAQNIAGIHRALAIDLLQPGVNEKQQVVMTGSPTGGTFTLTLNAQETAGIAYNATAAQILSALEALATPLPGDFLVTGGPLPSAIVIEFVGQYAETNITQMTANNAGLTGGSSPAAVVSTTVGGVAAITNQERTVTVIPIDVNGEAVSTTLKSTLDTDLQARREINFIVNVVDPTFTTIDVTFTATAHKGFVVSDVEARAEQAVTDFLKPGNWGRAIASGDPREWLQQTLVRFNELIALLENIDGIDHVDTLTLGRQGATLGTANVTLNGRGPLPRPGTINGTVVAP